MIMVTSGGTVIGEWCGTETNTWQVLNESLLNE